MQTKKTIDSGRELLYALYADLERKPRPAKPTKRIQQRDANFQEVGR